MCLEYFKFSSFCKQTFPLWQTLLFYVFFQITAWDVDAKNNGLVSYYWGEDESDVKRYFNLDSKSGQLTVGLNLADLGEFILCFRLVCIAIRDVKFRYVRFR